MRNTTEYNYSVFCTVSAHSLFLSVGCHLAVVSCGQTQPEGGSDLLCTGSCHAD